MGVCWLVWVGQAEFEVLTDHPTGHSVTDALIHRINIYWKPLPSATDLEINMIRAVSLDGEKHYIIIIWCSKCSDSLGRAISGSGHPRGKSKELKNFMMTVKNISNSLPLEQERSSRAWPERRPETLAGPRFPNIWRLSQGVGFWNH